jgi:hypothetical protein
MNPDLREFQTATLLDGNKLLSYLEDRPTLIETVMKKHEERIEHHFKGNLEAIQFAKKNGILETYDFLKKRK